MPVKILALIFIREWRRNEAAVLIRSQSGGMADALDSKSSARKGVWVRLPPLVLPVPDESYLAQNVCQLSINWFVAIALSNAIPPKAPFSSDAPRKKGSA